MIHRQEMISRVQLSWLISSLCSFPSSAWSTCASGVVRFAELCLASPRHRWLTNCVGRSPNQRPPQVGWGSMTGCLGRRRQMSYPPNGPRVWEIFRRVIGSAILCGMRPAGIGIIELSLPLDRLRQEPEFAGVALRGLLPGGGIRGPGAPWRAAQPSFWVEAVCDNLPVHCVHITRVWRGLDAACVWGGRRRLVGLVSIALRSLRGADDASAELAFSHPTESEGGPAGRPLFVISRDRGDSILRGGEVCRLPLFAFREFQGQQLTIRRLYAAWWRNLPAPLPMQQCLDIQMRHTDLSEIWASCWSGLVCLFLHDRRSKGPPKLRRSCH
jgi:hypothetical protein